jgi:hypothetical protein
MTTLASKHLGSVWNALRMTASSVRQLFSMQSPLTHSLLADLLDCNKTNTENPIAMIPSVIDQVKVRCQ